MNLNTFFYDSLQTFINGKFDTSLAFFCESMDLKAGDTVVDVGCGTGLLSKGFTDRGIRYIGLDLDEPRIQKARLRNPNAEFVVGDLRELETMTGQKLDYVIMHGVIHHINDPDVGDLLHLLQRKGCRALGTFDPIRPSSLERSPLAQVAKFLCNRDAGKHVRTLEEYRSLYARFSNTHSKVHRFSRWPVEALFHTVHFSSTR